MQISYKGAEEFVAFAIGACAFLFRRKVSELTAASSMNYCRALFVASVAIDMLLAFYIKKKIMQHKVETKVKVPKSDAVVAQSQAEKKEEEQEEGEEGAAEEPEEAEEVEISVFEYDLKFINMQISKVASSFLIASVFHMILKAPQPLIMQLFNPMKNVLFCPLYIEYLRGRPMLRPFSKNLLIDTGRKEKGKADGDAEEARLEPGKGAKKDKKAKKEE